MNDTSAVKMFCDINFRTSLIPVSCLLQGREEGQLWYPRKVAVMRTSGKYVVCDRGNERSRMQIFTKNGHFIKKIAIRYIDIVAGLAITQQGQSAKEVCMAQSVTCSMITKHVDLYVIVLIESFHEAQVQDVAKLCK